MTHFKLHSVITLLDRLSQDFCEKGRPPTAFLLLSDNDRSLLDRFEWDLVARVEGYIGGFAIGSQRKRLDAFCDVDLLNCLTMSSRYLNIERQAERCWDIRLRLLYLRDGQS